MKTNRQTILYIIAGSFAIAAVSNSSGQPVVTNQPQSLTNFARTTATFFVGADGVPPLNFQWWYSGSGVTYPLVSGTNASLTLSNVQAFSADGSYWAVVTNLQGAVTSTVATLIVLTPPAIIRQPANQTASLFADATFQVSATGDTPLSFQWRFNGGDLISMTNSILSITNIERVDAGGYDVVVTNSVGSVTSLVATLTIVPFNSITSSAPVGPTPTIANGTRSITGTTMPATARCGRSFSPQILASPTSRRTTAHIAEPRRWISRISA